MENSITARRTWAIKLGSAGICVPFCERHKIIGIGWKDIDLKKVKDKKYEDVWKYVSGTPGHANEDKRHIGSDTGNLIRFINDCKVGDYVLYYDPAKKHVQICKVISEALYRDFELDKENVDIWHYRKVDYPTKPISIIDFDGRLKGGLMGPRMSFWQIWNGLEAVEDNISGSNFGKADEKINGAFNSLKELLVKKSLVLTPEDWESVVADYLGAQGAQVKPKVGGNQPVIDVEAIFNRGELGVEVWRGQVKYYRNEKVDWTQIEYDYDRAGQDDRFFYVSVSGFTDDAIRKAYDKGIRLFEAGDFVRFFLSGKLRESLSRKLGLSAFEKLTK